MIHNGIEYGEMQLLAEVYHLFRFHSGKSPGEISSIFEI
jgi:6-phosphogluconate dehydrogenase|tara:strand:+ start:3259 stop:3375 length:117 start_codon:yes stop_codon:yes gene_type:complete